MRFAYFTHSLVSDWNHGNAHFLRGILRELAARGHEATAWEPKDSWSRSHLRNESPRAEADFRIRFPSLRSRLYGSVEDIDAALCGMDVVIVHEWTDPKVVSHIGRRRRYSPFTLLFHDTHHRMVSAPDEMIRLDLSSFDGVLAFGAALREAYLLQGWGRRVWTWHEAADTHLFHPMPEIEPDSEIVWIGNWGDGERTGELDEFLFEPSAATGQSPDVYGVRYPKEALKRLDRSGARYHGWLPNARVPEIFARHRMTVHVPRRFYVDMLPGVPTIRVFEALACGIPLICAPWDDCESLFRPGRDFAMVRNRADAERQMLLFRNEPAAARSYAARGLETIAKRHTVAHRVDELVAILHELDVPSARRPEMSL
ncbi:MAG: glycosyltransferase [Alphaproteobacteria bacterium]